MHICGFMQTCIHVNIFTYAHALTSIHKYMHASVYAVMPAKFDMSSSAHAYMCACMHVCEHKYMNTYAHACMGMHTCVGMHT